MKIKIKNTKGESLDVLPVKRSQISKKNTLELDTSRKHNNTLHYLIYFFVGVAVCIVLALAARFIFTIKDSTFVTPSYSLLVASKSPFIVVVNTDSKKLSLVDIEFKSSAKIANSLLYKIPLDGRITTKDMSLSSVDFPKMSMLFKIVLRPWEYGYDGVTSLDVIKLLQFSLSIPKKDIERVQMSIDSDEGVEGVTQDTLYDIFKDPVIINEQKSIEVVNATSTEGLAGSVAQLIKNTGGNVVSVASATDAKRSKLVASQKSQTLLRLSHILGIEPVVDENFSSISDIQIILGEDFIAASREASRDKKR